MRIRNARETESASRAAAATPSAPPAEQPATTQTDPCGQITCSGHGNCIVRDGTALCACHSGYTPDRFGINCLTEAGPAPGATAGVPVPTPAATTAGVPVPPPQTPVSCVSDADCKGGRICVSGGCQDSASPNPLPTGTAAPSTGWSLAAAIMGLTASAIILPLSIAGATEADDAQRSYDDCWIYGDNFCDNAEKNEANSWAFAGTAIATAAVFGPLVYAGGRSARSHSGVDGSPPLRISGVVSYGVSLTCAIVFIGVGLADEVPPALIGVTGGVGTASMVLLAIDALISRKEAKKAISAQANNGIQLSPMLAPVFTRNSRAGALLGLSARF